METVLTGMTAFVTLVHGGLIIMNRRLVSQTTLAIEFDIDNQEFVVKQPKSTWGGVKELRVARSDFHMIKDDPSAMYYDAKSGIRFNTINKGVWYNLGLFQYIMKNKNNN